MPCRIYKAERIISGISVAIPVERIPEIRHDGIRLYEAAQHRVVPACLVVVQAQFVVGALAGEAPLAGGVGLVEGLAGRALLAPWLVAQLGVLRQGAGVLLDRDAGAAQVVSQQVEDAVLF
jgi:hypothetical protein